MIFSKKAVLIVHGFAGGMYDMENLAFYLEKNRKLDIYMFTLPGHEKRTFKSVDYEEWIQRSEEKLNTLIQYGYKEIYLIGHSMGGVIATYLANKYSQVKKIVLAAPAFDYSVSNSNNTVERIKNGVTAIKANDKDEILSRFLKLPLSSLKQFTTLVEKNKESYKNLRIPVLLLHGKCDTLVPIKSTKKIYESLNNKKNELILIDGVSHDIFREVDEKIFAQVEKFLIRKK